VTFSARDPDGWLLIRFAFFQDGRMRAFLAMTIPYGLR